MFSLYQKITRSSEVRCRRQGDFALFGSRVGLIPKRLQRELSPDQGEPFSWHLSIGQVLALEGWADTAVVIDIKPRSKTEAKLCELLDAWGYTACGWTPILLRMRVLIDDEPPSTVDKNDFPMRPAEDVYTFLYTAGGVREGHLEGTWSLRGGGRTGGPLLSQKALAYFLRAIRETTPSFCPF